MDKCEISENINKIINELQKINSKCEGNVKNEIIKVIEKTSKIQVKKEDKQTSTEEKNDEEEGWLYGSSNKSLK